MVVGHDDSRSVIVLHDPTFGPYWAVSFDDFDEMWILSSATVAVSYDPKHREYWSEILGSPVGTVGIGRGIRCWRA